MNSFPDEFGIIDFYLKVCNKVNIKGYIQEDLQLIDVGKFETLDQAEQFISTLDHK
jgi:nucleotidyltransferase family protein